MKRPNETLGAASGYFAANMSNVTQVRIEANQGVGLSFTLSGAESVGEADMIEIISELPENVLGVRAKGRVTAGDYEQVLIPAVEAALKRHDRLHFYYELGEQFEGIDPGAVFEDLKVGLARLPHWEKLAVVTDIAWIRQAVSAFAFLIHGKVKVFPLDGAQKAKEWIANRLPISGCFALILSGLARVARNRRLQRTPRFTRRSFVSNPLA